MKVEELAERLEAAITSFPTALRPELLRILDAPDRERAAEIGRLCEQVAWREIGELLIDLEEEPALRRLVTAQLRDTVLRDDG